MCPSNIPLVQYYRNSKGEIKQAQKEKIKSDHARERFEFHKERIELAEKEKEAKRAARREAAQKAKESAAGSGSSIDIIAAAKLAIDDRADALFISCTALRSTEIIPEIERAIGKPVFTSNQSTFEQILHILTKRNN